MKLYELARSSGGDDDGKNIGSWKRVSFKGEMVYYKVSPVSLEDRGGQSYGLQVQIAVKAPAANVESEFVHDKQIDVKGKTAEQADKPALKMVLDWLNKHGTEGLQKRVKDWKDRNAASDASREAKLSKAHVGKTSLPKGYKIVDGPKKGHRFVETPDGKLIPNQGVNGYKSEQDIIDNFYAWQALQK